MLYMVASGMPPNVIVKIHDGYIYGFQTKVADDLDQILLRPKIFQYGEYKMAAIKNRLATIDNMFLLFGIYYIFFYIYLNVYTYPSSRETKQSYIILDIQQIRIQNKIKNYSPVKIAHEAP